MSHDPVQAALDELLGLVRQMGESFARMEHQLRDAKREALHQRTRTLPSPQGTYDRRSPQAELLAAGDEVRARWAAEREAEATTAASRAHAQRPACCEGCDSVDLCSLAGCQAAQDNEP